MVTISLTEDQAYKVVQALGWAKVEKTESHRTGKLQWAFPEDAKTNAFIQRIITKIQAELVKL